jgi:hypothetical protein
VRGEEWDGIELEDRKKPGSRAPASAVFNGDLAGTFAIRKWNTRSTHSKTMHMKRNLITTGLSLFAAMAALICAVVPTLAADNKPDAAAPSIEPVTRVKVRSSFLSWIG